EAEYILKIKKEGIAPGILRINTYTVNVGSNFVPNIFNLEINLTQPVASNVMANQDFGKIKWDSQRNVFDFDKEYVSIVEKNVDSVKTDSSKYPLAVIDKINKMAEEIITATEEQTKQKTDDFKAQQITNESLAKVAEIKNSEKKDGNINVNKNLAKVSTMKESEKKDENVSTKEKTEITTDKQKLALGNKKSEQTETPIKVIESKLPTTNLNSATSVTKKKTNEVDLIKAKVNESKLSNSTLNKVDSKNKNQISSSTVNLETNNQQLKLDNNQQSASTTSVDVNPSTFDGLSLFATNNQKNKLLEEKNKMERKKTENLTKKYETSNILTSLLDVVEAFDEK
ncbi:MAG: hypothetical protein K8R85_05165, partial [Bacteroidetes bacterium]|nr:hypothetical protein [Bacteroidota bacterium]